MFGGGGLLAGKAGASDGGGGGRQRPEVVLEEGKYVQVRNCMTKMPHETEIAYDFGNDCRLKTLTLSERLRIQPLPF